jgi:hypothetical protein
MNPTMGATNGAREMKKGVGLVSMLALTACASDESYVPFYEAKPINIGDTREHVEAHWADDALLVDADRSVYAGTVVEWLTFCEGTWTGVCSGVDEYATVKFVNGHVDSVHY